MMLNLNVLGVSYGYDPESRNPMALTNIKKLLDNSLIYDKNSRGPTEVLKDITQEETIQEKTIQNNGFIVPGVFNFSINKYAKKNDYQLTYSEDGKISVTKNGKNFGINYAIETDVYEGLFREIDGIMLEDPQAVSLEYIMEKYPLYFSLATTGAVPDKFTAGVENMFVDGTETKSIDVQLPEEHQINSLTIILDDDVEITLTKNKINVSLAGEEKEPNTEIVENKYTATTTNKNPNFDYTVSFNYYKDELKTEDFTIYIQTEADDFVKQRFDDGIYISQRVYLSDIDKTRGFSGNVIKYGVISKEDSYNNNSGFSLKTIQNRDSTVLCLENTATKEQIKQANYVLVEFEGFMVNGIPEPENRTYCLLNLNNGEVEFYDPKEVVTTPKTDLIEIVDGGGVEVYDLANHTSGKVPLAQTYKNSKAGIRFKYDYYGTETTLLVNQTVEGWKLAGQSITKEENFVETSVSKSLGEWGYTGQGTNEVVADWKRISPGVCGITLADGYKFATGGSYHELSDSIVLGMYVVGTKKVPSDDLSNWKNVGTIDIPKEESGKIYLNVLRTYTGYINQNGVLKYIGGTSNNLKPANIIDINSKVYKTNGLVLGNDGLLY